MLLHVDTGGVVPERPGDVVVRQAVAAPRWGAARRRGSGGPGGGESGRWRWAIETRSRFDGREPPGHSFPDRRPYILMYTYTCYYMVIQGHQVAAGLGRWPSAKVGPRAKRLIRRSSASKLQATPSFRLACREPKRDRVSVVRKQLKLLRAHALHDTRGRSRGPRTRRSGRAELRRQRAAEGRLRASETRFCTSEAQQKTPPLFFCTIVRCQHRAPRLREGSCNALQALFQALFTVLMRI